MQHKATNLKGETSIFAPTPYLFNLLLQHIDHLYITGFTLLFTGLQNAQSSIFFNDKPLNI